LEGWLRIDARGRASLDDDSSERLAGRSYRLGSGPEAILLGIEGTQSDTPLRPVLAGDLARIAFPEIVTLIVQARASGVLRVATDSGTRRVLFAEGEVRGAESERVGERLSEILVRMGTVKREQMEALAEEAGDARAAGRLAVARGHCNERDLWNAVQEHVTTIFQAILLETQGSFVLTEESIENDLTVPGLSAAALLMEGVRRLDELRAGRAHDGGAPAGVIAAYNGAFRDIFATAEQAGAGEALRRAAQSVFEDERAHSGAFRDLRFGPEGEIDVDEALERAQIAAHKSNRTPEAVLADALGTIVLFLLFVAGEHLEPRVHRALHARVKAITSHS
jgi:uncharacterized protein DUF4388